MRFRKFIISNYRAVNYAEVSVGKRLIPLIGINESGKTSILQAILAFDRVSDRYGGGAHLNYRNKYEIGDHDCSISAEIVVDREDDINGVSRRLRLPRGHQILESLQRAKEAHTPIQLRRSLNDRTYSIEGIDVPKERADDLAKALYQQLPLILYFDDFTDRVPQHVEFVRKDNRRGYRLKKSRLAEWQKILEEVFSRATDGEHSIRSFINMQDHDERMGLLPDINDELNDEVLEAWRELKKVVSEQADDPSHLKLILEYDEPSVKRFRFQFRVGDRAVRKKRFFNVVDRSKGFQWFFNFQMKLKYNPKYQRTTDGAIYLLDEPGSYLHSSGQTQLLRTLQQISRTNTILYCTHSQHLLDPDQINVGHTRIVGKEEGKIKVISFGSAGSGHQGALSPLFDALHLKTGVFNKKLKKVAITEGITDFYFFRMLQEHFLPKKSQARNVDLIPGAGAQHLKDLISMAIAWANDYVVLLDSDDEGRQARARYKEFFGSQQGQRLILYTTPSEGDDVKLEDFLSESDTERLRGLTEAQKTKRGIAELFFAGDDLQREFFSGLDTVTKENLEPILGRLEELGR